MPRLSKTETVWWLLLLVGAAAAVATLCMGHATTDYTTFLHPWVRHIRSHGYFRALSTSFANYNQLYLYLLTLIALIPGRPLVWIKLLSLAFQLWMGWYMGRIIALRYRSARWPRIAGPALALLIPTATLNSLHWGQCDACYTCFVVATVYYLMVERPMAAMVALGVAFSFKLQTVFILPFILVMLLTGRLHWRYTPVPVAVHLLSLLPAWIAGRPWAELLGVYVDQGSFYTGRWMLLFGNFHTLACGWKWIPRDGSWDTAWLVVAFLTVLALCLWAGFYMRRHAVVPSHTQMMLLAVASCMIAPLLLPQMHDRYLFPADILAVTAIFYMPRLWPMLAAVPMVSLVFYWDYFWCRYSFNYLFNPVFIAAAFVYILDTAAVMAATALNLRSKAR